MINKQKNEKNINPKNKNNINPLNNNNNNKRALLSLQMNSKANSNKSQNKFNLKRVKNYSIPNFIDKKKEKKEITIKKVNLRNINQINERQKKITTKNNQIINRINTTKTPDNLFNICKLSKFLKNTDLRQTIIIDDEGNNNLNLIIKESGKNACDQKGENIKEIKRDDIREEINDDNINSPFTSLFLEDSNKNNNIINKESKINIGNIHNNINMINLNTNNMKKNNEEKSKDKDKDNKRLDEYSQLFKLLNDNIEQFKNIIHKKDSNLCNKDRRKSCNNDKDKQYLFSSRENYKNIQNEKKVKSQEKVNKIILFNKTQNSKYVKKNKNTNYNTQTNKSKFRGQKIEEININNTLNFSKEKNISDLYSFLDSFTQDDLFQPLDNKHQKKSSKSLTNIFKNESKDDNAKKIKKKEIDKISSNEMSTNNKCDDEEIQMIVSGTDEHIKYDKLKNRDINPHFFSNDFVNKINKDEKKNVYINKECVIF